MTGMEPGGRLQSCGAIVVKAAALLLVSAAFTSAIIAAGLDLLPR